MSQSKQSDRIRERAAGRVSRFVAMHLLALAVIAGGLLVWPEAAQAQRVGDRGNPPTVTSTPTQTGPRSSPFDPPEADDRTFVTDAAPLLDTGCLFRSSGPIVFEIKITRHVGELNPDGTLKDAAALVAAGLLSPTATLIMPGFDVDSGATPAAPREPERDRVLFNGEEVGFLSGLNNQWLLNSFNIPIEKVKFAQRASFGSTPAGAVNTIQIDIDVANEPIGEEVWCTAVDWGALSFKAMSPIIVIHGNNSDAGFYDRQGFTRVLRGRMLLHDGCSNSTSKKPSGGTCQNPIDLPTASRRANALRLNRLIPGIVQSYGVDSVHVVVHSKGGLDTRDYLANFQPRHENQFTILSYSSLSTPHNGSMGADVLVARDRAIKRGFEVEFSGFPSFTASVAEELKIDAGTPDLTTTATARFNLANIPRLSKNTVYNTVAADADLNGNGEIDRSPDEYKELRDESPDLTALDQTFLGETKTRIAINTVYQIMRSTKSITVTCGLKGLIFKSRVCEIKKVPTPGSVGNDVLVTIPSGHGTGSFAALTTNTQTFTGSQGRNHSTVASFATGTFVANWITQIEKTRGDLR